jgi:ABC-2 type transport system ATP-binding protein
MSEVIYTIELNEVSKEYPGIRALNKIDLKVKKGTIHGFLGPNGAGKSTAMNIIAGLIPPSAGKVFVLGEDSILKPDLSKKEIGILPEHPPLYLNMKVRDYLEFSQKIHGKSCDKEKLEEIITKVGLNDVEQRLIGNLSKGFRQRVGMAGALVYDAKIIILDEPMVGLDPGAIAQIRDLIVSLKKDHTILLSTHQLYEAAKICDEITIIQNGEIKRAGTIDQLRDEIAGVKRFEAIVENSDEDLIKVLNNIDGVSCIKLNSGTLQIDIKSKTDMRAQVTKAMTHHGDLLQFFEHQIDLEEIFKEVVKREL